MISFRDAGGRTWLQTELAESIDTRRLQGYASSPSSSSFNVYFRAEDDLGVFDIWSDSGTYVNLPQGVLYLPRGRGAGLKRLFLDSYPYQYSSFHGVYGSVAVQARRVCVACSEGTYSLAGDSSWSNATGCVCKLGYREDRLGGKLSCVACPAGARAGVGSEECRCWGGMVETRGAGGELVGCGCPAGTEAGKSFANWNKYAGVVYASPYMSYSYILIQDAGELEGLVNSSKPIPYMVLPQQSYWYWYYPSYMQDIAAISNYTMRGGTLVTMGDGVQDLLAQAFGIARPALSWTTSEARLNNASAAGSAFEGGPSSLSYWYAVRWPLSGLPPGARSMYDDGWYSSAVVMRVGRGQVVWLAYDDGLASTGAWQEVLRRAVEAGGPCVSCGAGTYRSESEQSCTACPGNSTSEIGSRSVEECECKAGYYGESRRNGGKGCQACPPGAYSPRGSRNASSCRCSAGTTWGQVVWLAYDDGLASTGAWQEALVDDYRDVENVLRDTEIEKLFGLESRSEPVMRRISLALKDLSDLGSGGYLNSGTGSTAFLSSNADFYSWYVFCNCAFSSILYCASTEYPGFGRFGCAKDCGDYNNVTTLTIKLEDMIDASQTELGFSLTRTSLDTDPARVTYSYNVYSYTMGEFIFENDIKNNSQISFEVPDGKLTLVLYQTTSAESVVDDQAVITLFGVTAGSFSSLVRQQNNMKYGNPREILKTAVFQTLSLKTLCQTPDDARQQFCTNFNPQDIGYTGLQQPITQIGYCAMLPKAGDPYIKENKDKIINAGTSSPPTPTVKILEEATMKPAGYDQQLVSYIATQIYSKTGVTYMREASRPNLVTNGSVLLFYLGTNRNVAQMYLRLTACFRYQDITLPSPNYDSYSNIFMPAPKITFSLPIGSDSCNGKNSTQEWRSVVQQFLNSSISYAQQIVSTNIVPAIEPKGSWKATAGVIVGSTVKSSALVNLLLDSRDIPDAQWVISVDTQITKRTRDQTCLSHFDCDVNLFCSKPPQPDMLGTCKLCSFCKVDKLDAIGDRCPVIKCPTSGGFPQCLDAPKLVVGAQCPSDYSFELWRYRSKSDGPPQVVPSFKPKNREITPYNRIIGAIVVSQSRMKSKECSSSNNEFIKDYLNALKGILNCPSQEFDPTPFGYDPSFMSFSPYYNPRIPPEKFYAPSERHVIYSQTGSSKLSFPIGFFPHKYDSNYFDKDNDGFISEEEAAKTISDFTAALKDAKVIIPSEADTFKLFFDERLTQKLAQTMIRFMQDGSFIDSKTAEVRVEFLTYNAPKNIFAIYEFTFQWLETGRIPWNDKVNSFSVDFFANSSLGALQIFLFTVIVIILVINCFFEAADLIGEIRQYNLTTYLSHPFNWVDWTHLLFMWGTVITCIIHYQDCRNFRMKTNYPILYYGPQYEYPRRAEISGVQIGTSFELPLVKSATAQARHFRTNNQVEAEFLQLVKQGKQISDSMSVYSFFAGVSIVLFVFRMLKGLDFQERMGLVTRTIARAAGDLWHFILLFGIVLFGYAVVGNMLFGHQYEGMKDLSTSILTLLIFLLSLDTTQFYAPMSHAASDGAFHIFLWSYLFIAFFILLNIFLAILVDAYAKVKEETEGTTGLIGELMQVLWHGARKVLMMKNFVSDQRLEEALAKDREKMRTRESRRRSIERDLAKEKLILLSGGISIDSYDVGLLVRKTLQSEGLARIEEGQDVEEGGEDSTMLSEEEILASVDLMNRYGTDPSQIADRRRQEKMELYEMQSIRRQIAMQLSQNRILNIQKEILERTNGMGNNQAAQEISSPTAKEWKTDKQAKEVGILQVRLLRATKLPRMDMITGCDPYCMLFVNSCIGLSTFASEVSRKNVNPEWDEVFEWTMTSQTKVLSMTLWDKDEVTSDDLIGSAQVNLSEIPFGEAHELSLPLHNQKLFAKLEESRLIVAIQKFHMSQTDQKRDEATMWNQAVASQGQA
ncbi:hypothetical protein GUITHDRAFT_116695 [Guillardia theta CCMP2712]|uniref:C2 domain-containing protein n=1 Tax=Guillardia theta (strain CCMP2712) TaxID=905079 RepID=L1ILH9_GUITC|nr:hypothetical protein GUITHDRAFT_116695 [Guillardia theta CCMP2712]EKX37118.1 hypothetical protein GUITHDRAFT_116695 [Guillardia theta CCMP2712]|eukprot:XP_005824098.1 hypothetical protein GUITHDRAFT_116695 [Guillardia theta CCMP2712]